VCSMAETCLALRDHGSQQQQQQQQQQEPEVAKWEGAETREAAHAMAGETSQAGWKGEPKVLRMPGCG
jgi:hypothetical protein